MDRKKFKRVLTGEEMPDKNDPKYRERYEREKHYGEVFAEKTGLNWLATKIQLWANNNRKLFLLITFGFVIFMFLLNILSLVRTYKRSKGTHTTAVERVDKALKEHHRSPYNR